VFPDACLKSEKWFRCAGELFRRLGWAKQSDEKASYFNRMRSQASLRRIRHAVKKRLATPKKNGSSIGLVGVVHWLTAAMTSGAGVTSCDFLTFLWWRSLSAARPT
jgi:hypothetical protein